MTDRFDRRELLKGTLAAGTLAGLASGLPNANPNPLAAAEPNRSPLRKASVIREENERFGTTGWQLTYTRIDQKTKYRCPWIEGYVSRSSVYPGQSLDLMVSANPAGEFVVDLYRLGHYGGDGGRHVGKLGPFQALTQDDPPVGKFRLRECRWPAVTTLEINKDWPSGVYLGKLSLTGELRYQSYVVFIVRDDRPADIIFQCSDNTWQAYNRWPDNYSLYDHGDNPWALVPGVKVSFDRPYGKYCQIVDAPLSQGSGEFLLWEFPAAYWLEQQGYDVTYVSNSDVHADPACLTRGKVFLSVGHDEYWSREQFAHVQAAVEQGVSVGFLSGNTCCFVAPMEPSSEGVPARIIERAGRYGGVSEAEKEYMGPFTETGPNEATLIGARTTSPFNGSGDWIVSDDASWLFADTGMKNGDRIPGLVGWEFHGDPAPIPGLKVVATGPTINGKGKKARYTATLYPGPKNNWVFNASTIFWAQGLSQPPGHLPPYSHFGRPHGPDDRVRKITSNFLRQCGAEPLRKR